MDLCSRKLSTSCIVTFWLVLVASLMLVEDSSAQVTFSRDWNAGKRGLENPDVHNAMKSATALCHLLINQLKRLAACELPNEDLELAAIPLYAGKL